MNADYIDFDIFLPKMIDYVVDKKCEINITITPDTMEIQVMPWKQFNYTCPYNINTEFINNN